MTYEELVARLTAAIDAPPNDGNANEPDEGQAEAVLARLVAAHGASDPGATAPDTWTTRHAAWENNMDLSFAGFDHAVRSLMAMLQARSARYPDADPVPVELRGEIIDEAIRAMDPDTEIDDPHASGQTATGYLSAFVRHARELEIPNAVIEAALACARAYESFGTRAEPTRPRPRIHYQSPFAADYTAAKAAAQAFVEYLDGP